MTSDTPSAEDRYRAVWHATHIAVGRAFIKLNKIAEQYAIAHLRAAIRGVDHPIHDDGRPFNRADDA